jgi:hypothetical protein
MKDYETNGHETDGTEPNEPLHELELREYDSPAIVTLEDGRTELYVNHSLLDNGWLRVQTRGDRHDRTTRKYPPHKVASLDRISTRREDGAHKIDDDEAVLEFLGNKAGWA